MHTYIAAIMMRTVMVTDQASSYEIKVSHHVPSPGTREGPARYGDVEVVFVLNKTVIRYTEDTFGNQETLDRPFAWVTSQRIEAPLYLLSTLDKLPRFLQRVNLFDRMLQRLRIPDGVRREAITLLGKVSRRVERERIISLSPSPQQAVFTVDMNTSVREFVPRNVIEDINMEESSRSITTVPASEESIKKLERFVVEEGAAAREKCLVCLEDIGSGNRAARTECGHVYHEDCIVKWLRISRSCPICRSQSSSDHVCPA